MRVVFATLWLVIQVASALAQTTITVSHLDGHFQWNVPPYTVTEELNDAPESFVITCGALTATVPMPTDQNPVTVVRYPIADLLPTPGQYQCDLYAQNSAGRQADPNVPFPLFESGYTPSLPGNVAVLAEPSPSPTYAIITRLGSVATFTSSSNSGSGSVTIPSGADLCLVGVSGFLGASNYFSHGSVSLGGVPFAVIPADGMVNAFMGALFYGVPTSTGAQSLVWDWSGTTTPNDGVIMAWACYSGVDRVAPIRSSSGSQQLATPHQSDVLTAQPGDYLAAWVSAYSGGIEIPFAWSGASEIANMVSYRNADASWAEAAPSGNQSVSADGPKSGDTDGGIMAVVLKPAVVP